LFGPVSELFAATGVPVAVADDTGRELCVEREGWRLLFARPRDTALFVERGAASFGCAGRDALLEEPREVVELLDLGIGACRLALAAEPGRDARSIRYVATKYPRLTERFLAERGLGAQVILMNGALESAPRLGLAEGIVDLVQSGATLRANGLVEVETIVRSTARLIANPVAFRLRQTAVRDWLAALRQCLRQRGAARERLNDPVPAGTGGSGCG
jgi:ATP phosphoribosyltransferase